MHVVVFLKQVPDNTKLKLEQLNGATQIPRQGVEMMMNPFDEYALETALLIKEATSGTVTVISLGTPAAKEMLKKALAAGADNAFVLSDEALLSSDRFSTALALHSTLNKALQTLEPAQVLLFGNASLDEAAGETGLMVAELLNYPSLTACKNVEVTGNTLKVTRETNAGLEIHEVQTPAVLCLMKCDYELRTANIKGVMKANKAEIPIKSASDIGLAPEQIGANAAKTNLVAILPRPEKPAGQKIEATTTDEAVQALMNYFKAQKVI